MVCSTGLSLARSSDIANMHWDGVNVSVLMQYHTRGTGYSETLDILHFETPCARKLRTSSHHPLPYPLLIIPSLAHTSSRHHPPF